MFPYVQVLQVTDPAIIAEALRSKELDKKPLSKAFQEFAGPHGLPSMFTAPSDERWKGARCSFISHAWRALLSVGMGLQKAVRPCTKTVNHPNDINALAS